MRLISFRYQGEVRIGAVVPTDRIVDLHSAYQTMLEQQRNLRAKQLAEAYVPSDMKSFLQGGGPSLSEAGKAVEFALGNGQSLSFDRRLLLDMADVKVEAPICNPGKIICVGHNYREHILEMGREIPEIPVVFAKFSNTLIADGDPIPKPVISDQLDYEAEFAFIIGKQGKNISQDDAMDYVVGYTVANDVSVRDYQKVTLEWLKGKTFDGTLPLGPCIVTKDEILNPHKLEISLTVNGEERQHSNTQNLVFNVPFLVSFLSKIMTLEPGDLILTGTPGGVGVAREPQTFLRHGDQVRVEIEKVGSLENKVVDLAGTK
jgi:acylpyruvate hydrolase